MDSKEASNDATINVSVLSRHLKRVWRFSRTLTILSCFVSLVFIFLIVVILWFGHHVYPKEYTLAAIPVAIFFYFYTVSGTLGSNFIILGTIAVIIGTIDAVVVTDVNLDLRHWSQLDQRDTIRLLSSWFFMIFIAVPALLSSIILIRSQAYLGDRSFRQIITQVNNFKMRAPNGSYFRSSRRPFLGFMVTLLAGIVLVVPSVLLPYYLGVVVHPAADLMISFSLSFLIARPIFRFAKSLIIPEALRRLNTDPRLPILLLRAFEEDQSKINPKNALLSIFRQKVRLEEAVCGQLESFGPFIAVGYPSENLPSLGASRAYFEKEDCWQTQVSNWMKESRFIVFIPGTTKWVAWEMNEAIKSGNIDKLIFIFPSESQDARSKRIEFISQVSDNPHWVDSFSSLDPENVLCCCFTPSGNLTAIRGKNEDQVDYEVALTIALDQLLREYPRV